jgi:single-stranded DNA-binding protein
MSAFAMISGRLWKSPDAKTTKTGAVFATATVRVAERERAAFWNVIGFGEVADDLLKLEDGDSVSVSGPFQSEVYLSKSGESRVSHRITADRLASPRIGRRPADGGAP